jgi:hypothetical protein
MRSVLGTPGIAILVPILVFAACAVDDIELRGMPCPCPPSLVCEKASNTCTDHLQGPASSAGGAVAAGGAAGNGGTGGTSGGPGGGGAGASSSSSGPSSCKTALVPCGTTQECCGKLQCDNTSAGHVCCGLVGEPCVTFGGEDCCQQLECLDDKGAFCNGGPCHCTVLK